MLMVLYSGIGAKRSEQHTTDEFLDIMNRNFVKTLKRRRLIWSLKVLR